jgi:hypothetical protein
VSCAVADIVCKENNPAVALALGPQETFGYQRLLKNASSSAIPFLFSFQQDQGL